MSKKKSYMDKKNILSEDVITSFFKGLWRGMRGVPEKKKKTKTQLEKLAKESEKKMQKHIDGVNGGLDKMYSAINKVRKDSDQKPLKRPSKLTLKDIKKQLESGK